MENQSSKPNQETIAKVQKSLDIKNIMAVPKLTKIVINCSLGEALGDKKILDSMSAQIAVISGQKPQVTKAKKAISTFKLRVGDPIGLKVTLRGGRMYNFLTKLITMALPRVRDFRGVPRDGFDNKGNYTLGIREQTIFPELDYKMVDKVRGFEITMVNTAGSKEHALVLLETLGLPFEKMEENNNG